MLVLRLVSLGPEIESRSLTEGMSGSRRGEEGEMRNTYNGQPDHQDIMNGHDGTMSSGNSNDSSSGSKSGNDQSSTYTTHSTKHRILSVEQQMLRTAAQKLLTEKLVLAQGMFDMGTSLGENLPQNSIIPGNGKDSKNRNYSVGDNGTEITKEKEKNRDAIANLFDENEVEFDENFSTELSAPTDNESSLRTFSMSSTLSGSEIYSRWIKSICNRGDRDGEDAAMPASSSISSSALSLTSSCHSSLFSSSSSSSSPSSSSASSSSSSLSLSSSSFPSSSTPFCRPFTINHGVFRADLMTLYNTPEEINDWCVWLEAVAVTQSDKNDIKALKKLISSSSCSSSSSSSTSSSSCCLIIATSVTIPDIIEKKGLDEDVMLSKAEEEKLKIKKLEQKSRDSNGIFGSRSTGWLKVESKETEEMKIGPYKKVQLISKCVENALQTWARKDMIIQAGVTVCNYQESSGTWTLEPDGARAFLPHIKNENVIVLPGSDFAFFLRIGCEENEDGEGIKSSVIMYQDSDSKKEGEVEVEDDVSIGVEVERSNGDIFHIETAISSHSKKTLWKYCVERLELLESSSSSFSLIIVVDDVIDNNIHKIDKNIILSEGNQIFKRRLSKAEKKNLKSNSKILRPSNSDQNNINNDSKVQIDSESTEHKMVLVLTVSYNIVDNSYEGVRLNTATSADVCNSYMTAMYSLKL